MKKKSYLILGHGLAAEHLILHIKGHQADAKVLSTSRKGQPYIEFDLNNSDTWKNLPQADYLIWTFPPVPLEVVKLFFKFIKGQYGKIIVVGSTSALKVSEEAEIVNEDQALDLEIERVKCEVFLKERGGVLVLSSGIYGPERSPLDWVRSGRVGKSDRWINMIHLEDLAQFLFQACQLGDAGKLYIASNNNPQTWREVITQWEKKGLVENVPQKDSEKISKRIDCSRSIKDLQVNLRFQSFSDSVS